MKWHYLLLASREQLLKFIVYVVYVDNNSEFVYYLLLQYRILRLVALCITVFLKVFKIFIYHV